MPISLSAVHEETITIDVNAADLGTTAQSVALTSTDLTSLVIVGDNAVFLGELSGTAVTSIDATGLSGVLTVSAANATGSVTLTANTATTNTGGATLTGGASDDIFIGTANADVFTGGGGNDTITTGAGADTIRLDDVGADTVTDFTTGAAGDIVQIDVTDYGTVIDGDGAVSGGTAAVELVTGQETLAATDNIIVLSGTTFASAALAGAALESGGARQITASASAIDDDDVILFVYSDGTNAYLVEGIVDNATTATTIDAGGLTESVMLTFSGLDGTEIGALVSANFEFV